MPTRTTVKSSAAVKAKPAVKASSKKGSAIKATVGKPTAKAASKAKKTGLSASKATKTAKPAARKPVKVASGKAKTSPTTRKAAAPAKKTVVRKSAAVAKSTVAKSPRKGKSASASGIGKALAFSAKLRDAAMRTLSEHQAEDIAAVDLSGRSPLVDYIIVATGRSARHVAALADHVGRELSKNGAKRLRIEGLPQADWALIDAGDIIIHVFRPDVRRYYGLDELLAGPGAT